MPPTARRVLNMARGKVIYRDGDFLTIDIDRVKREVADYACPCCLKRNKGA